MSKNKEQKVIYYSDEINDEFSDDSIKAITIDENYKYGEDSFWWNVKRFFWYRIITIPLSWAFLKIKYHHKIVGKEILKSMKHKPYFMYGNHTNQMGDPFIPGYVCDLVYIYAIVHANNVSIPFIGKRMKYIGAMPLPATIGATKNFMDYMKLRIEGNYPIVIYPEAHIWPYYTKIRPFLDLSFRYPVQYKLPAYCFTNTYQKRRFSKTPKIVTYIDGPFWPDENLSAKEQKKDLRNKVYNAMVERSKNNNVELIKYIYKEKENNEVKND